VLFLRERACEEAQGFYFSRPMNAADFSDSLHRRKYLTAVG
jgi:EAL domain-containing protein (putative c-di-GMP-specific phosphodiesterase class I)